jgi:hypothetical protein
MLVGHFITCVCRRPPDASPSCSCRCRHRPPHTGSQQLVVAKGPNDATSVLLQLWRGARLVFELAVPKVGLGARRGGRGAVR